MVGIRLASMLLPAPGAPRTNIMCCNNLPNPYQREMTPKAYSYVRFSTPEQKWGDSLRRQEAEAKEWADKKGIELDMSLRDLGKSGYKGVHRKKGALGRFLDQVQRKVVPRGSYLVVEDIDRLSREHPLDATTVLTNLLHAGITIVNLRSGTEISSDSVRADAHGSQFGELISDMNRAHRESQRKARLSKANWDEKLKLARSEKKGLTSQVPGWIKVEKIGDPSQPKLMERKMTLIEDRAKVVKLIFRMSLRGRGTRRIAKMLNKTKTPCWGKGKREGQEWHASYIQKILHSRTVLGELEPHEYKTVKDEKNLGEQIQVRVRRGEAIKDYYPRLISDEDFKRVAEIKEPLARHRGGKHSGRISNLVPGLTTANLSDVFDWKNRDLDEPSVPPPVNVPVVFVTKNAQKDEQYLVTRVDATNRKRNRGAELAKARWNYHAFEYGLLTTLQEIDWQEIADWVDGKDARADKEDEILALEQTVKDLTARKEKLLDQLEISNSPSIRQRHDTLEAKLGKAQDELNERRAELDKVVFEKKVLLEPLEIQREAFNPWNEDARLRLRVELAERIKEIILFPKVKDYRGDERGRRLEFYYFFFCIIFKNGYTRYVKVAIRRSKPPEVAKVNFKGKEMEETEIKSRDFPEGSASDIPDDEIVDDHLLDEHLSED
jgi:DNA invertase Pin-like site-specific DNA recombinase